MEVFVLVSFRLVFCFLLTSGFAFSSETEEGSLSVDDIKNERRIDENIKVEDTISLGKNKGKISFRKSDRRKKKERKILSDESKIDEYWVKEPTFGDKSSSDPDLGSTSREHEKKRKSSKKRKRKRNRKKNRKNKKSKSLELKMTDKVIEEVKKLKDEMIKGMQSKTGIMTKTSAYLAYILMSLGAIQKQLHKQDCFEEVPYDGPTQQFTNPITGSKKVSVTNARTAKSCQLICQKEETCKYFTWLSSTNVLASSQYKCFLKTSKTGSGDHAGGTKWLIKQRLVYNKIISGPKYCTTPCRKPCNKDSECGDTCPVCKEAKGIEDVLSYEDYGADAGKKKDRSKVCTKREADINASNRRGGGRGRENGRWCRGRRCRAQGRGQGHRRRTNRKRIGRNGRQSPQTNAYDNYNGANLEYEEGHRDGYY